MLPVANICVPILLMFRQLGLCWSVHMALRIDNTGAGRFSVFDGLFSNYKA